MDRYSYKHLNKNKAKVVSYIIIISLEITKDSTDISEPLVI